MSTLGNLGLEPIWLLAVVLFVFVTGMQILLPITSVRGLDIEDVVVVVVVVAVLVVVAVVMVVIVVVVVVLVVVVVVVVVEVVVVVVEQVAAMLHMKEIVQLHSVILHVSSSPTYTQSLVSLFAGWLDFQLKKDGVEEFGQTNLPSSSRSLSPIQRFLLLQMPDAKLCSPALLIVASSAPNSSHFSVADSKSSERSLTEP